VVKTPDIPRAKNARNSGDAAGGVVGSVSSSHREASIRPLDRLAVASLILCCAIWGVNQVAMKVANAGIDPLLQAGLRSIIAGALLWLWVTWRGVRLFERDRTLWAGIATGVTFAANFMCVGPGLSLTEASRGVLFYYSAPFFTAIGAHYLTGWVATR
jgi:drug/metabolite transporter (DMT)-like permease